MLRYMCGHTRQNKIRNEVVREKQGSSHCRKTRQNLHLGGLGMFEKRLLNSKEGKENGG